MTTAEGPGHARRPPALAFGFWTGPRRRVAWALAFALVMLTLAQVAIPIALNVWSQRLFDAIEQRDVPQLLRQVGVAALIVVASLSVMTAHLAVRRRLQIDWRSELTDRLLREWVADGRYDQLSRMPGPHDNPDGRIAEDIRIATEFTVDLAHSLLYCVLLLVSFTQILWVLSGPPEIGIGDWTLYLPGHLVWIAFLYAGAGAGIATLLGRPLVRAANRRQDKEADFRVGLVRVRERALTIALRSAEAAERRHLARLFDGLVGAWRAQTRALAHLFMFSSSWSVMTQAVPVLVAAPRYMAGAITLGVLMQTAQAFQQVIAALAWPIDNMQKLAECRASIARVSHLHESLLQLRATRGRADHEAIVVTTGDEGSLDIDDLSLSTPDGNCLVQHFSASIGAGERVVLQADPPVALNLFRAVAGLWPWGSGSIRLPRGAAVHFVPRRPRHGVATLREALLHVSPTTDRPPPPAAPDVELSAALRAVGLAHLSSRLDESANWSERLSGPDRQRLAIAQVLVLKPAWIFMREATSELGPDEAARLLRLIGTTLPGSTIVATGRDCAVSLSPHRLIDLSTRSDPDVPG
ncbi:MAG: ABC transporter ATP-binding protein/permease [Lautropia sp.]